MPPPGSPLYNRHRPTSPDEALRRDVDSECPTPDDLYIVNPPAKVVPAFQLDDSVVSPKRVVPDQTVSSVSPGGGRGDAALSQNGGGARHSPQRARASNKRTAGDILNLGGEKFPAYDELHLLPDEIQKTLMTMVMDYMRKMVYPRMMFLAKRKHRRQAMQVAAQQVPQVPTNFLQNVPLFSRWTNLDSLARSMELAIYEKDELIVVENDTTQSGILFLMQGTIQIRKLKPVIVRKGFGNANTIPLGTLEPISVYGERIFLTEEPRMESLKATSRCVVWVLKREPFFSHLNQLSEDRRRDVINGAMEFRRDLVPVIFPLTGAQLKRVPLLSNVPLANLDVLASRCEPRVVPEGRKICKIGDVATEMWFIARGQVDVFACHVDGHEVLQARARAGTIVGEMAVLFSQKRNVTLVAVTSCDMYAITRDTLASAINSNAVMGEILQGAHKLQAEWQLQARTKYLEFISEIPFIKDIGDRRLFARLLDTFHGRVYPIHSTVISVSECANRLIIITRGKAKITSSNTELRTGECLGFTALVPHRWTYHVTAQETVECIELPFEDYRAILREFGYYDRVRELTHGLLYPRVHPDAFQEALGMVRHCRNPPCFPTSSDTDPRPFGARVNPKLPTPMPVKRTKSDTGVFVGAQLPRTLAPLFSPSNATAAASAQSYMASLHVADDDPEGGSASHNPAGGPAAGSGGGVDGAGGPGTATAGGGTSGNTAASFRSGAPVSGSPPLSSKQLRAQQQRAHMARLAERGSSTTTTQIRAAADVERLSKRILELQMAVGSPSPARRHSSLANGSSTHVTPGRGHRLAPLHGAPTSPGASSPTTGVAAVAAAPGSPQAKRVPPPSATVATQTVKSYLQARAKMLEQMTGAAATTSSPGAESEKPQAAPSHEEQPHTLDLPSPPSKQEQQHVNIAGGGEATPAEAPPADAPPQSDTAPAARASSEQPKSDAPPPSTTPQPQPRQEMSPTLPSAPPSDKEAAAPGAASGDAPLLQTAPLTSTQPEAAPAEPAAPPPPPPAAPAAPAATTAPATSSPPVPAQAAAHDVQLKVVAVRAEAGELLVTKPMVRLSIVAGGDGKVLSSTQIAATEWVPVEGAALPPWVATINQEKQPVITVDATTTSELRFLLEDGNAEGNNGAKRLAVATAAVPRAPALDDPVSLELVAVAAEPAVGAEPPAAVVLAHVTLLWSPAPGANPQPAPETLNSANETVQ